MIIIVLYDPVGMLLMLLQKLCNFHKMVPAARTTIASLSQGNSSPEVVLLDRYSVESVNFDGFEIPIMNACT